MNGHNKKTALVTGATGFVGSNVARRLVTDGWNVHLIVRESSELALIKDIIERVTLHRHDGSSEGMRRIVHQARPGMVFHLASLFIAQHQEADIEPLIRSNILFATQLVDAMTSQGVFHLVNTGTSWQHYNNQEYEPACLYAATKQAFESILCFYLQATPLRVITLKLFDTYGPSDPRQKLFAVLRNAAHGHQPLAMSPGEQLIDLVYIDDVVDAFMLAGERISSGESPSSESYAVSSGKPIRLRTLVELYGRVSGRSIAVTWGGRPYREREVMIPWSKGTNVPGWRPRIELEEGIRRMTASQSQNKA